ncbi:hypothetical protein ACGFW5_01215 [Streptomyces sp. NPDC048416]|uniref:hypothetical protein n=1 Tax=Streptomyces sp. NPDC048416 TaxID=3365546 RepID=UPI003723DCF8
MRRQGCQAEALPSAAYKLQWVIGTNAGYSAWTAAWQETSHRGPHQWRGPEALRVIAGPLLSQADRLTGAIHAVLKLAPEPALADILHQTQGALRPLLPLQTGWMAVLKSEAARAAGTPRHAHRLAIDLDFGGLLLEHWEHEEEAVSLVIAVMPLLERLCQALTPLSGADLTDLTAL